MAVRDRHVAVESGTGRVERSPTRTPYQKVAGVLLSMAGVIVIMGIITGEALYPARYDTTSNTISDLGGTMPSEGGVALQPSAAIFDATMLVAGPTVILGAYFVHRAFGKWGATIPLALFGLGALGVGVFPGNVPVVHPIFAMIAFFSGGVAAVLAHKVTAAPFRYISVVLGVVALVSVILGLFFLEWRFVAAIGVGGIERWMVYPVVLWLAIFGGYMMGYGSAGRITPGQKDAG